MIRVTTRMKNAYTIPFANRINASATKSGRTGPGRPRRSRRTCSKPWNRLPTVSASRSYKACCTSVPTTPTPIPIANTHRNPGISASATNAATTNGAIRNAVRRNVSVLANPRANRLGSVACFTIANVPPNPNDFQH